MLKPHERDPLAVFASVPPWTSWSASRVNAPVWRPFGLEALLAEPESPRDPLWFPTVAARVAAVSVGPLLSASQGPLQGRLELARVPVVDPTSDLDAAREAFWPALPALRTLGVGYGSPAPSLVIVGERDPYDKLPFLAKSGVWTFAALRLLGWDELGCYLTNALSVEQHPRSEELAELRRLFGRYEPTWLALGNVADEALRALGIAHAHAPHPAQHRRFKFKDGPESYAVLLREAGVPLGPHHPHGPPAGTRIADVAGQLVDFFGLPRSVAYRRDPEGKRTRLARRDAPVDPAVLEAARRAYVLGNARTFRKAGLEAFPDASPGILAGISLAARRQKWDEERAAHLARVREHAKDAAVESETKAALDVRRLVWDATRKAAKRLVAQLDGPDVVVRAQDVKAIGEFALAMSDRGDTTADAARETLEKLSLSQLGDKLKQAEGELFGDVQPQATRSSGPGEERDQHGSENGTPGDAG